MGAVPLSAQVQRQYSNHCGCGSPEHVSSLWESGFGIPHIFGGVLVLRKGRILVQGVHIIAIFWEGEPN